LLTPRERQAPVRLGARSLFSLQIRFVNETPIGRFFIAALASARAWPSRRCYLITHPWGGSRMLRVCAWCGLVLGRTAGDCCSITHTICPDCAEQLLSEWSQAHQMAEASDRDTEQIRPSE